MAYDNKMRGIEQSMIEEVLYAESQLEENEEGGTTTGCCDGSSDQVVGVFAPRTNIGSVRVKAEGAVAAVISVS